MPLTWLFFFKQTKCFFAKELITVLKAGFLASSWKTHILLFGQNPSKILLAYKSQYQDTSSLPKWDEFPGINIAGEEENLWLMLRWGLSLSPAHFCEMWGDQPKPLWRPCHSSNSASAQFCFPHSQQVLDSLQIPHPRVCFWGNLAYISHLLALYSILWLRLFWWTFETVFHTDEVCHGLGWCWLAEM